jgi:site-specific recombinase XerD
MPSGSAVIRYSGKRGTVWRLKFRDASGVQVMETLGKSPEWNRRKAKNELRNRLTDVEREGFTRPRRLDFGTFADTWLDEYPEARGLKHSTRRGYAIILDRHLKPALGRLKLSEISVEEVERLVVAKRRAGLSPATVNRALNVLSLVLNAALRRGLVRVNVVSLIDRPREPRRRWRILSPVEVRKVEAEFSTLIEKAETERDGDDLILTRRLFLFHMGTALRRGEAAGLRWRSVFLADPSGPMLRVEETWVRHRTETPKSDAGRRTISLGEKIAAELWDHRQWSQYRADDDYVFPNPRTGRPFDASRYGELLGLALRKAGIEEEIRPSHELRHSSITNAAAAGASPEALMSRAGHSSYATTRRYIDLAGERFREEADRLEDRLWGGNGRKSGYKAASALSEPQTEEAGDPHAS